MVAFTELAEDNVRQFGQSAAFVIFPGKEEEKANEVKKIVGEVAEIEADSELSFYSIASTNKFNQRVRDVIGIQEHPAPLAVIMNLREDKTFILDKSQEITADSVKKFIADYKAGSLQEYIKSAPRPANDRNPDHPELYVFTANSFKELVLDSDKDVLVDVYADWCGPCRAISPKLVDLAKILSDVPTVAIGKINCDENKVDKKYFPENGIPNIKLFVAGNKESPIKYNGDRTVGDMLTFIHTNASHKFDLDKYMARAAEIDKLNATIRTAVETLVEIQEDLEAFPDVASKEEQDKIQGAMKELAELIEGDTKTVAEILGKIDELKTTASDFSVKAKKAREQEELKSAKNVKKMHSDEEFEKTFQEAKDAKKVVVVDFTASWCGPCQYIAPMYADLSEEFPEMVFLKVDVDELSDTAAKYGIQAMPTFMVFKGGEKVEELQGADPKALYKIVSKHNKK